MAWCVGRTVQAAVTASYRSGIRFRRRWKPPVLEAWEEPLSDPEQPMIWHPDMLQQSRDDRGRSQEHQAIRTSARNAN